MSPPTERRGQELPRDNPVDNVRVAPGDCISSVPAEVLEELVKYHGITEPVGEPVPPDERLV
jgi:hypothetical protein